MCPPKIRPSPELIDFYSINVKQTFDELFSFHTVSEQAVATMLLKVKTKAAGVDLLDITLIQLCCPFLVKYITYIVNECIRTSYFPRMWKKANVIPVPKVKNPSNFKQLRSISILPVLSKILEQAMAFQMKMFTEANKLIPPKQSGFRKGYNCNTALSLITDDLLKALDENTAAVLILLDYTKAFDTIDHSVLKSIFHYLGFREDAVRFLSSYLEDRVQCVSYKNRRSDCGLVTAGVPQGSVLGPLLYAMYTSTFAEKISFCKSHFYADDTQLYCTFTPEETVSVGDSINSDLDKLFHISSQHSLGLNPAKSSAILFCHDKIYQHLKQAMRINVNGINIPIEASGKSLGLVIDRHLRFKQHVNGMIKNAYFALKTIYPHRHYLSKKVKILLCDTLVLSRFTYCDNIYGPCLDSCDAARIQRVQKSCLRLIFGIRRRQRVSHKLAEVGWLSMFERRLLHSACFFFKIIKFKTPPYLLDRITFRTDVHNLNIRRRTILTIPQHNKQVYKRSFSYNIAMVINRFRVADFGQPVGVFKKYCYRKLSDSIN